MSRGWTADEIKSLIDNYPTKGMMWCCSFLDKTGPQVRQKASRLGLKQDRNSDFFLEWQKRAAESKIGKKRPDQSVVMKKLHDDGKLVRDNETNKLIGAKFSEWIKENGHPKGFLNHSHTEESKLKISEASNKTWSNFSEEEKIDIARKISDSKIKSLTKRYNASWKCGWRTVGLVTCFFRSRWEANYARYLEFLKQSGDIISWEHECVVFSFPTKELGCYNYLPDFKVTKKDSTIEYHEVKGWFDERSKLIFKSMEEYYQDVVIVVIDKKYYEKLDLDYKDVINEWERK